MLQVHGSHSKKHCFKGLKALEVSLGGSICPLPGILPVKHMKSAARLTLEGIQQHVHTVIMCAKLLHQLSPATGGWGRPVAPYRLSIAPNGSHGVWGGGWGAEDKIWRGICGNSSNQQIFLPMRGGGFHCWRYLVKVEALTYGNLLGGSANTILNKPFSFHFFFLFVKRKMFSIKLEDTVLSEFSKRFWNVSVK